MRRITSHSLLTALTILALVTAPSALEAQWGGTHVAGSLNLNKDGDGSLGESTLIDVQGDVVTSGVGLRGVGQGDLVVTGIPVGATVERAFLYWATLGTNPFTSPTLDGMAVAGSLIGTGLDTCWDAPNNFAYRADVTSIVSGNGSYQIAGLPSSSPTTDDSQGAALVVIYRDGGSSQRGIVIHDGAVTIDLISGPFSYSHDIVSFEPAASADAHVTYLIGDGQPTFGSGDIEFGGVTLSTDAAAGLDGDFWDTLTYDVTAQSPTPPVTTSLVGAFDCLLWVATIFSVEGAADPDIFGDGFESGDTSAWSNTVP